MDPRQILGTRRMTLPQYAVIGLCVLINMIDGYDILALAQASPVVARAWDLSEAEVGWLFSMNLIGMALGALGVSPIADQWGRRPAILGSLVFMSVGMVLSALSGSFEAMAMGRVITGIGIGGMTSTAGMLALEYARFNRREFASSCVASAYPLGSIVGASVAVRALGDFGWQGIFWVGAAMSALLFPIAWFWLAESLEYLLARQPKNALARTNRMLQRMAIPPITALPPKPEGTRDAVIAEIVQPVHLLELAKLFVAHALNMFAWYYIINWAPKIYAGATQVDTAAADLSRWMSYGGILGGLAGGYLCGALGVKRMMWVTMIALAGLIVLFGQFTGDTAALRIIAPLTGAALFGSATANWLTIAYAFPTQLRATGLGLCTLFGRIGSIFGPVAGGYLLNAGQPVAIVCAIMAAPAVLSALTFNFARRIEPGR